MKVLIVDDRPLGARKLSDDILSAEPDYLVEMAAPVGTITAADRARQIVREASDRFDVFLIDDNMGAGLSGSELMTELRQLSPSSEAIIFTAYADEIGKQRAIEAGARAYVPRPINEKELLWQLRGIQKDQSTRRERDWLQLLTLTTEKLQQAATIDEVGQAVVDGVQRLGFQRARLRRVCGGQGEQLELIGISQLGNSRLPDDFTTAKHKLPELPYSQAAIIARKPVLFSDRELGEVPWDEFSIPPQDDWFKVPLLFGDEPVGTLSIDNGALPIKYAMEEKQQLLQLLDQFGKQAAAALERARLHEKAEKQAQVAETLRDIGRIVTTQAAKRDLDALLETIRQQLGTLLGLDVSNFMAVLLDEETGYLDFRCHYDRNIPQPRHWREYPRGLAGHLIQQRRPLLFQDSMEEAYRTEHDIETFAELAQCWLGVPLYVEDKAVGALILLSYDDGHAYDDENLRVVAAVANHVAGAVQIAYQAVREQVRARQLEAIQQLNAELPRLARGDEDAFWHAVLTVITHRDGLSFNRAALLLYDADGRHLRGRYGIGERRYQDAHDAWERDEEAGWSLGDYLKQPSLGRIAPTSLTEFAPHWLLKVESAANPFHHLKTTGESQTIDGVELARWLPKEWVEREGVPDDFSSTAVLAPVKHERRVQGVVLIDNAFDGEPIAPSALDNLERLLSQAIQELDQARALYRNQAVFRLVQQVMAGVSDRPLRASLEAIAHEAQRLTEADLVAIYPLQPGSDRYDRPQIMVIGKKHPDPEREPTDKPRLLGVAGHILRAGALVVDDVSHSEPIVGEKQLAEHPFLSREEINAFIGVRIHEAATAERLGVLYLDYRTPKRFTERDVALAEDLAQATATVIRAERNVRDREEAEATAWSRELEMRLLHDLQETALEPNSDERSVITAALRSGKRLLGDVVLRFGDFEWTVVNGYAQPMWREYILDTLGRLSPRPPSKTRRRVMEQARTTQAVQRDGHHAVVPIHLGKRTVGAFLIELPPSRDFGADLELRVGRLATTVALALENVRRQKRFRALWDAAKAITAPTKLQPTLDAIVDAATTIYPGIECVTLWYENPLEKELLPGPPRGLIEERNEEVLTATRAIDAGLVGRVMHAQEPIWAEDTSQGPLKGDFIAAQKVKSAVAFPLRVEGECVGALFINYRQPHDFTPEEREVLPIFAAIAAASLQDVRKTQHAEQRRAEAERGERRLGAALEVVKAAGAFWKRDQVLRAILVALRDHFGDYVANAQPYLLLYNAEERVLELPEEAKEFYPTEVKGSARIRLSLDAPRIASKVAQRCLQENQGVVVNIPDVTKEDRYEAPDRTTRSELCAGLWRDGKLQGTLVLKSPQPRAFTKDDERLFELVAEQVAAALERANQVAEKGVTDYLTGAMAWAADVAHDINIDIGYIRFRAYWLRESETGITAQGKQWAREIDDRAGELADKARDESSERSKALLEAGAFLEKKVREWQPRACPNTNINYELEDAELPVLVYPEQMWRAVRHLLRNALEAMAYKGQIWLRVRPFGSNQVELQVENSGADIPPEVRQRLFREPFSTKSGGMGLLIAKMLIEGMDGTISLLPPEEGRGPVFAIRLPRAQNPQEEHNDDV